MSHTFPAGRRSDRQRGVAGVMAMLFLLVVVGFSAVTLLNMSTSDLQDTTAQNNGVAALFLAESGIERAGQLYSTGTPCSALVPASPPLPPPLPIAFGRGSVVFTGVAPILVTGPPDICTRVQSRGVVGNTVRTVEVDLQRGPTLGDIAFLSASSRTANSSVLQWNHTIPAPVAPAVAANRIVLVGVSIRGVGISVTGGTYNGVTMAMAGGAEGLPAPVISGSVRVEWLYAINPAIGTRQIRVTLSATARAVAGAFAFSGADLVKPIDVSASGTGNFPMNPAVSVVPVTDKTWIVDVLAAERNSTATAGPGQTNPPVWRVASGGSPATGVYGAGSYRGPVSPIAPAPMAWTLAPTPLVPPPTHAWAHSALALRPVPFVRIVRWTEI